MTRRFWPFLAFNIAFMLFYWSSLRELFVFSLKSELYSHIPLVPLISAYLLYKDRDKLTKSARWSVRPGTVVLTASLGAFVAAETLGQKYLPENDYYCVLTLSIVASWISGFLAVFGMTAVRTAAFPLSQRPSKSNRKAMEG